MCLVDLPSPLSGEAARFPGLSGRFSFFSYLSLSSNPGESPATLPPRHHLYRESSLHILLRNFFSPPALVLKTTTWKDGIRTNKKFARKKEIFDKNLAVFCANVRRLRSREGLSKAAFARIMGVSVHTINRLEQDVLLLCLRTSSVILLSGQYRPYFVLYHTKPPEALTPGGFAVYSVFARFSFVSQYSLMLKAGSSVASGPRKAGGINASDSSTESNSTSA